MSDIFRNGDGYTDRTAGLAIREADNQRNREREREKRERDQMARDFIKDIRSISEKLGLKLTNRIALKDLVTGKEYK